MYIKTLAYNYAAADLLFFSYNLCIVCVGHTNSTHQKGSVCMLFVRLGHRDE